MQGAHVTTQRPVCTYQVLTGPIPAGLSPGATFTHHAATITPELARVLLDRRAPEVRRATRSTLDAMVEELRSGDKPTVPMVVRVAKTGETVAGCDFLEALVLAGRWARADVEHNVKLPVYIARKRHRGLVKMTEKRAHVLRELLRTPSERRCVDELARTVKLNPATVHPMMQLFERKGWVSSERTVRHRWYSVRTDSIDAIRAALEPPPSEPDPVPPAADPSQPHLIWAPPVITLPPLAPARLGITFELTSAQYTLLSELLLGEPAGRRFVDDLRWASGTSESDTRSMINRLIDVRWVREWYEIENVAAQDTRLARRCVELTDAGAEQARIALRHHEPLSNEAEPGDPADIAAQLGGLLRAVQKRSNLYGTTIAAHAGHGQPWWSKLTAGHRRSVDLDALRKIIDAVAPPEWQSQRIIALAKTLNKGQYEDPRPHRLADVDAGRTLSSVPSGRSPEGGAKP